MAKKGTFDFRLFRSPCRHYDCREAYRCLPRTDLKKCLLYYSQILFSREYCNLQRQNTLVAIFRLLFLCFPLTLLELPRISARDVRMAKLIRRAIPI